MPVVPYYHMYEEILGISEKIKKILPNLNEMPHKSGSVSKGNKTVDRQKGENNIFYRCNV